jgi:hypothetical protein
MLRLQIVKLTDWFYIDEVMGDGRALKITQLAAFQRTYSHANESINAAPPL